MPCFTPPHLGCTLIFQEVDVRYESEGIDAII